MARKIEEYSLDRIDARILSVLQRDTTASVAELGSAVGLSASACHRRIKLLEQAGVIDGYVVRVDADRLGLHLNAFVEISLSSQSVDALEAFEEAVRRAPEILECHLMAGDADYVLRVIARDMADFERIHRLRLSRLPGVTKMHTSFSLRTIKPWRGLTITPSS